MSALSARLRRTVVNNNLEVTQRHTAVLQHCIDDFFGLEANALERGTANMSFVDILRESDNDTAQKKKTDFSFKFFRFCHLKTTTTPALLTN